MRNILRSLSFPLPEKNRLLKLGVSLGRSKGNKRPTFQTCVTYTYKGQGNDTYKQCHGYIWKSLTLLISNLHTFLFSSPTYDACKPSLMRLRLTSAPKSISLFNICLLAASANQCKNSEMSVSGSARSPPTQAESDVP